MFSVPTRTRYGMRALIQMALSSQDRAVSLMVIAETQSVSKKYLEIIFKLLKKAGIVNSIRGPEGGYYLVKDPSVLTVFEIVDAIDGPIQTVDCYKHDEGCGRLEQCITRQLWNGLQDNIVSYLKSCTLEQLIQQKSGGNWVI